MTKLSPFRTFKTSPEIIRLTVMIYVRFWCIRFGPMLAAEIRKRRVEAMCSSQWRWHLDEIFVTKARDIKAKDFWKV